MSGRYCCECGAYADFPIYYEGGSYCQRCASKIVDEDEDFEPDFTTVIPLGTSQSIEVDCSVNVPLNIQKHLLRYTFFDTAEWLKEKLDDEDFLMELEEMANARLKRGYEQYGSTMYAWSTDKRLRAVMEELADVMVYRSSW